MLFSDKRQHKISIPAFDEQRQPTTTAFLIRWLCENLMDDPRRELFVLDNSVYDASSFVNRKVLTILSRPGILVLINDADWELEGEEKYELQSNDNIVFVSTLHGG